MCFFCVWTDSLKMIKGNTVRLQKIRDQRSTSDTRWDKYQRGLAAEYLVKNTHTHQAGQRNCTLYEVIVCVCFFLQMSMIGPARPILEQCQLVCALLPHASKQAARAVNNLSIALCAENRCLEAAILCASVFRLQEDLGRHPWELLASTSSSSSLLYAWQTVRVP